MILESDGASGDFSNPLFWTDLLGQPALHAPGALDDVILGAAPSVVTLSGAGSVATMTIAAGSTVTLTGQFTATTLVLVQTGGTLVTNAANALTTAALSLHGGTANLAALSGTTSVDFGAASTLDLHALTGAHAVTGFGAGDTLKFIGLGGATLAGNLITTGSGSLTLNAAPSGSAYRLSSDGQNGIDLVLGTPIDDGDIGYGISTTAATPAHTATENVYRFFDSTDGTHLFTADWNEVTSLAQTRPDMVYEGVGLQALTSPGNDPNTIAVFRFFDTTNGTHFYTGSALERDTAIATRSDLVYEPGSTFYEHAAAAAGDVPVYRFFDTVMGTHFYATSQSEVATIAATRPDMTNEGICFYMPGHG